MTSGGDIEQFDGKIHAHHSQQVGAEFRSACCKLSQMPQVPLCESHGTPRYYVSRTGQTTIGAHISDELTRSKRHSSVSVEKGFEVSSYYDDGLGYGLTLFENNLPGRAVDPSG